MKIYIASRYIKNREINRKLYHTLCEAGYDVFLPECIDICAITIDEMLTVADICYKEIETSDIILVVGDYGKSVSSELGYSIAIKRLLGKQLRIIAYNSPNDDEAMIRPFVERNLSSISELIEYLNSTSCK